MTKSPYWFVRVYLGLVLISPLLNRFLDNAKFKEKFYLLFTLLFISVYGGVMGDEAYADGKNITLFMALYVMGDLLKESKSKLGYVKTKIFFLSWILLNFIIITSYVSFGGSRIGDVIWTLSYPYCSPLLILNAVLFFLMFSRMHFKSEVINYVATSVFSVYILTEHSIIRMLLLQPVYMRIYDISNHKIKVIAFSLLFAIFVMTVTICIDKLFQPLFKRTIELICHNYK